MSQLNTFTLAEERSITMETGLNVQQVSGGKERRTNHAEHLDYSWRTQYYYGNRSKHFL